MIRKVGIPVVNSPSVKLPRVALSSERKDVKPPFWNVDNLLIDNGDNLLLTDGGCLLIKTKEDLRIWQTER